MCARQLFSIQNEEWGDEEKLLRTIQETLRIPILKESLNLKFEASLRKVSQVS